jgi:hypothetical protein
MKPVYTLWCALLMVAFSSLSFTNRSYQANSTLFNTERAFFRLGDQLLTIAKLSGQQEHSFILVNLHHNEATAIAASQNYVQQYGGQMVVLENGQKHNVDFEFLNKKYSIDPIKIFTTVGRNKILRRGPYKTVLSSEVQKFAGYILESLPYDKHVVAVHNVADGERTIHTAGKYATIRRTKELYFSSKRDEHDYFITTDETVFNELKAKEFNVILQSDYLKKDDGSLSIVVEKNRRTYIDIIAQEGHLQEQQEMIETLAEILDR